eukprot:CAMPEP_0116127430 /NCGR_PEP_ID=MMETSP0329-20121206/6836_1 /TAXON_ID=697910 /ORGANISM="Pseudo-nitzschia arenysensis, Strain B593" /LENGTH=437 /DNA_ID=CAMNT_0003621529 /DNA_START=167 /DNA_END=1480 /DNA_ORIENTATION=-
MARKRTRSLPIARLAAWQCLVLSLLLSILHCTCGWVPSSAINRRTDGQNTAKSRKQTSLAAGNGVLDFVKGLDSALGNPTASSAAQAAAKAPVVSSSVTAVQSSGGAVSMNIPNSLVLVGGGAAFLAFLGIAFFFVSQKDDDFFDDLDAKSGINTSFGAEDVTPLPKRAPDANAIGEQIKVAETKFAEQRVEETKQTPPPPPAPVPVPEPVAVIEEKIPEPIEDSSSGSILSKLKAKLARKSEELEENQELLASETDLRKETEVKLESATTENEGLTEQLASKEQDLVETTEKWNYTKSKLQEELKLKETLEAELKEVAEANRLLEDKFELGQNSLMKTRKQLNESNESLDTTKNRLTRTQGELTRIHGRLQITQKVLDETSEALEKLEEERNSLRAMSGKMWRLSKSRVTSRVRSVGDRLRGRGPKKNKKKKNFKN